jgi:hypothetical protein
MSDLRSDPDRLFDLVGAVCDGVASQAELAEIDSIMSGDHVSRHDYIDYCRIHVALRLELRANRATQLVNEQLKFEPPIPASDDTGVAIASPSAVVPWRLFGSAAYGSTGYFSSGWPVAYLVATAIFAIGLVIGAIVQVSEPAQTVQQIEFGKDLRRQLPMPHASVVGCITGMVDCVWEGPGNRVQGSGTANHKSEIRNHESLLHLGDRLALRSGLLEITYDAGAKVILQGPVRYEVESPAGGYLSVGKLTAKLEKKLEVRGRRSESANQKSEIRNQELFAVRTPTAVVTDLGTEFGVEVSKAGDTTSHVFRGSVEFKVLGVNAGKEGNAVVVRENESVETDRKGATEAQGVAVRRVHVDPKRFVRRLPSAPNTVDLLDIVAGGDGTGHHRERGIDPTCGMEDPVFIAEFRPSDRDYHRARTYALIDGTFVPNGGDGPVVIDSAQHTFDGFPHTDAKAAYGSIWARAAGVREDRRAKDPHYWVYFTGPNRQYTPEGRGLLGLHANVGVTFNVEAIRAKHAGQGPTFFRGLAGLADARGQYPDEKRRVDLWIFVEGRLMLKQPQIRPQDGAIPLRVAIGPRDRFLTIAVTDGGNGVDDLDWFFVGDPVLEMGPR